MGWLPARWPGTGKAFYIYYIILYYNIISKPLFCASSWLIPWRALKRWLFCLTSRRNARKGTGWLSQLGKLAQGTCYSHPMIKGVLIWSSHLAKDQEDHRVGRKCPTLCYTKSGIYAKKIWSFFNHMNRFLISLSLYAHIYIVHGFFIYTFVQHFSEWGTRYISAETLS